MRILKDDLNIIREEDINKSELEYFNFLHSNNFEIYIYDKSLMTKTTFIKDFKYFKFSISFEKDIYCILIRYKQSFRRIKRKFAYDDLCLYCFTLNNVKQKYNKYTKYELRKNKLKSLL